MRRANVFGSLVAVLAILAAGSPSPAGARPPEFCQVHPTNPKCTSPAPTVAPTPTATPTPTTVPTATPTIAPTPTATIVPTATPTSTPAPTPTPTAASPPPYPTVTVESQAWWRSTGIIVPTDVGKHIHVLATFPADGHPIDGTITIRGTVTLHNQTISNAEGTDRTNFVRVAIEDNVVAQVPLALGPCADCTAPFSLTFSLAGISTGRHELRVTANIPRNSEGNRQYQSFGEQVCVRLCTPSYRPPGPWNEARGWYTGHGYANPRLDSPLTSVCSGCTIRVTLHPGSGGLPTHYAGVFVDPRMHDSDPGIVVGTWSSAFSGSLVLPHLASGPHKLALLSSDGDNAGVLSIPFVVP